MTVDTALRSMLERQAAAIDPAPDAWRLIEAKLKDPQPYRPSRRRPVAVVAAAAAILAVSALASALVADPKTTVRTGTPGDGDSPASSPPTTASDHHQTGPTTTAFFPSDFGGLWPADTAAGIDDLVAQVAAGELEPGTAEETARRYLRDHLGLDADLVAGREVRYPGGSVRYLTAAGAEGEVVLWAAGSESSPVWFVLGLTDSLLIPHAMTYNGTTKTMRMSLQADFDGTCTFVRHAVTARDAKRIDDTGQRVARGELVVFEEQGEATQYPLIVDTTCTADTGRSHRAVYRWNP